MLCPKCGGKTRVDYCRPTRSGVERARVCKDCSYRFYTSERIVKDRTNLFLADKIYKNKLKDESKNG